MNVEWHEIRWREETWYSNIISFVLIIGTFLIGLYVGIQYESAIASINNASLYAAPLHAPVMTVPQISGEGVASGTSAYVDPNGVFSFDYPDALVQATSDHYLPENEKLLVELDYTSDRFSIPSDNNAWLSNIWVVLLPAADQNVCDTPGSGTPDGQTKDVPAGGILWYEGSQGSVAAGTSEVDDFYRNYHSGSCWSIDFEWVNAGNQTLETSFEQSILGTFRFLKDEGVPYVQPASLFY